MPPENEHNDAAEDERAGDRSADQEDPGSPVAQALPIASLRVGTRLRFPPSDHGPFIGCGLSGLSRAVVRCDGLPPFRATPLGSRYARRSSASSAWGATTRTPRYSPTGSRCRRSPETSASTPASIRRLGTSPPTMQRRSIRAPRVPATVRHVASTRYRALSTGELPSFGVSYVLTQVSPMC